MPLLKYFSLSFLCLVLLSSCSKDEPPQNAAAAEAQQARQEQAAGTSPVSSSETETLTASAMANPGKYPSTAQVGILYFLDHPNHRATLLEVLQRLQAETIYENQQLGLLVTRLSWSNLNTLLKQRGDLGLSQNSLLKVELDQSVDSSPFTSLQEESLDSKQTSRSLNKSSPTRKVANADNPRTRISGPAHSAGYGAKIDEFRAAMATRFGKNPQDIHGQDTSIAVFDVGFEAQNIDIVGERVQDIVVTDYRSWIPVVTAWADLQAGADIPAELSAVKDNPSLRFLKLTDGYRLNDSLSPKVNNNVLFAVARTENDRLALWVKSSNGHKFKGPYYDFADAKAQQLPTTIDMTTGEAWRAGGISRTAAWIKLRKRNDVLELALQGMPGMGQHGSSNLHMAAGERRLDPNLEPLHGVAPKANVLLVQPWAYGAYGGNWSPLAIGIAESVAQHADIINLDIYVPGSRFADDMLSRLLCRVVALSDSIPVVAAHNFGPLSNTVQNLAQSPCVITVGASISVAAAREAYEYGPLPAELQNPDDVYTAHYSGRGFGYFGTYKPDIISPAYAYTPYGNEMIRFGGTSGATPTTAGALALLKQAAKLASQSLNFTQARFILQAASVAPPIERAYDGYGFLDMEKAAQILQKHLDATPELKISPLLLVNGPWNPLLKFNAKESDKQSPLELQRKDILSNRMNMVFNINTNARDPAWLNLNHPASGTSGASIEMDLEPAPQSTTLQVSALANNSWDQLQSGISMAYIRGIRKDLQEYYGPRAADILIPAMAQKGIEFGETLRTTIPATLSGQVQRIILKTNAGEVLTLSGTLRCDANNNISTSLALVYQTDPPNSHASSESNSYSPVSFTGLPLNFSVNSSTSEFAFYRTRSQNCPGSISGELLISRSMIIAAGRESLQISQADNKTLVKFLPALVNTSLPPAGAQDRFQLAEDKDNQIVVTRQSTGNQHFVGNALLKSVEILGVRSHGVLQIRNAKNELIFQKSTTDADNVPNQFGDRTSAKDDEVVLSTDIAAEGSSIDFLPLQDEVPYTIRLRYQVPDSWKIELNPATPPLALNISFANKDALAIPAEWLPNTHFNLATSLSVIRSAPNAEDRHIWQKPYLIQLP